MLKDMIYKTQDKCDLVITSNIPLVSANPLNINIENFKFNTLYKYVVKIKNITDFTIVVNITSIDSKKIYVKERILKLQKYEEKNIIVKVKVDEEFNTYNFFKNKNKYFILIRNESFDLKIPVLFDRGLNNCLASNEIINENNECNRFKYCNYNDFTGRESNHKSSINEKILKENLDTHKNYDNENKKTFGEFTSKMDDSIISEKKEIEMIKDKILKLTYNIDKLEKDKCYDNQNIINRENNSNDNRDSIYCEEEKDIKIKSNLQELNKKKDKYKNNNKENTPFSNIKNDNQLIKDKVEKKCNIQISTNITKDNEENEDLNDLNTKKNNIKINITESNENINKENEDINDLKKDDINDKVYNKTHQRNIKNNNKLDYLTLNNNSSSNNIFYKSIQQNNIICKEQSMFIENINHAFKYKKKAKYSISKLSLNIQSEIGSNYNQNKDCYNNDNIRIELKNQIRYLNEYLNKINYIDLEINGIIKQNQFEQYKQYSQFSKEKINKLLEIDNEINENENENQSYSLNINYIDNLMKLNHYKLQMDEILLNASFFMIDLIKKLTLTNNNDNDYYEQKINLRNNDISSQIDYFAILNEKDNEILKLKGLLAYSYNTQKNLKEIIKKNVNCSNQSYIQNLLTSEKTNANISNYNTDTIFDSISI